MCAMATKLTYELTYDAPLTEVRDMLMQTDFREQVCAAQHAKRHTVTVDAAGAGGHKVVVDQVWASEGIPGFARKFVGDEIHLAQTEHWDAPDHGTVDVEIPGKPGTMKGTIRLAESGGTTTETVDMEIKVSIPLVGGKIEGLVSDLLKKSLSRENAVGRSYLAG